MKIDRETVWVVFPCAIETMPQVYCGVEFDCTNSILTAKPIDPSSVDFKELYFNECGYWDRVR